MMMRCRCVVRYGYKDVRRDENDFENQLIANLAEFIQNEESMSSQELEPFTSNELSYEGHLAVMGTTPSLLRRNASFVTEEEDSIRSMAMSDGGDRVQVWPTISTSTPFHVTNILYMDSVL